MEGSLGRCTEQDLTTVSAGDAEIQMPSREPEAIDPDAI